MPYFHDGHQCLNCQNYRPRPHESWKPPSYDKNRVYSVDDLYHYLTPYPQWNSGWPGRCLLNPTPVEVRSVHICGQWAVNPRFLRNWDELGERRDQWNEIQALRGELKAAKKLSLERFHRLQQAKLPKPPRRKRVAEDALKVIQGGQA